MSSTEQEMSSAEQEMSPPKPKTSTAKPETSTVSRLSNVLPTGTFLVFQILAPLATNNGNCRHVEVVLTSVTLVVLCLLCVVSSFSDSCKDVDGVVHYGIVTHWGLWNINFNRATFPPPTDTDTKALSPPDDPANSGSCWPLRIIRKLQHQDGVPKTPTYCPVCLIQVDKQPLQVDKQTVVKSNYYKGPDDVYVVEMDDYVCAALSVVALATISLLTTPVTTCFYPHLSEAILKTVPVLVGLVVAAVCACGVTPRNGIGFTPPTTQEKKQ